MVELLFRRSLLDLKKTYKKHIIFEFFYMLITGFIFVPIIAYIFNRVIWSLGSGSLLNTEIFRIVLNYRGIFGLLSIATIAVVILFIQFGVIIVISQKQYFSKSISILHAFDTVIKKTPKIVGFGVFQLITLFVFLIPFIDSPLLGSLSEDIEIKSFIRNQIFSSRLLMTLYGLVFILIIYIIIRWIFTLHFIIIENKSVRKAVSSSMELTKKNQIRIIVGLFVLNIIIFLIGIFIISGITLIPSLITDINLFFLDNSLVTLSSFITYVFALMLIPINITFVTRLFYRYHINQDVEIEDKLIISKNKKIYEMEDKISTFIMKKSVFNLILLTVYLIMAIYFHYTVTDNIAYIGRSVAVAGHRGDMYNSPENTISSVRSAIEKEVDFVEIDIQITKDNVIVLNHDRDLARVAGVPYRVIDLTYEELSVLEVGSHFSDDFMGEKIPTLEEVLIEVKDQAKLILDIKAYGNKIDIAENLVALIEKYEMVEQCYIQSFNYPVLQEIRKINPDIKIGQLMYAVTGNLATLDVDFYSIEQNMLSNRIINNARRIDREIWVWTVNNESNMKRVLKYDIDVIITGYPEMVQSIIGLK
ncbi:glycerophosphoryl diester phosphodiesterase [Natranaerovirga pectinivora]|uniref:Glycerophosphoryl diester phosphodiesterase n=1 Tax=Natranaerovirga pectinivora TaxID=682400 RepID=A0A4R3MKR1_9FIRM|nr:glycerophosphoryl diester phosphodiesterase membrane domain-containing protein [Natranaerovirga pectinivora]TCT14989.1 glycerophosphoryl diester phosphodiesterase [Natranaerovirga pectinivora]